jgi:mono/diheme cytochrome c family protein
LAWRARTLVGLAALTFAAVGVLWLLTEPRRLSAADLPAHLADTGNGEYLFRVGGCAACHAAPGKDQGAPTVLAGGLELDTPFGTFVVPNISPDPGDGIGAWSTLDFVNAMKFGTRPDGAHLYPAFPYPSFQRMTDEDLIDLKAYLDTLPKVGGKAPPHRLFFPFGVRRGIGLWNLVYARDTAFTPSPGEDAIVARGEYLVTGPGHCGECHTPRDAIGGPIAMRALSGAPLIDGSGVAVNITQDAQALGSWTAGDIVDLFVFGADPGGRVPGPLMAKILDTLRDLTPEDQEAIAAYLKSLPPIASPYIRKASRD